MDKKVDSEMENKMICEMERRVDFQLESGLRY